MVVIREKGIICELDDAAPSSSQVVAANPLAKVPTLILDDGRALYDSSIIVEYLDGLVAIPKLIPEKFEERIEVKRWEALGNGIMDAAVAISHENREPKVTRKGPDFYPKQQMKIDSGLATMENDLNDEEFCHGDTFTLADIACGCTLICVYISLPKMDWRKHFPAIARNLARIAKRGSFNIL